MAGSVIELPVVATINAAWSKVSGTKKSFWAGLLLFFLMVFVLSFLQGLTKDIIPLSFIFACASQILAYYLQFGLIYMGITRAKDQPINFKMIFHAFSPRLLLFLLGLYILQLIIFLAPILVMMLGIFLYHMATTPSMAGGVTLIVLAIIAFITIGVRMSLSMAFLLDSEMGPWACIKQSFEATRGNFWNILGMFFILWVIMIISVIPLGIGLIWALPFFYICYGMIYLTLRTNALNPAIR